MNLQRRLDACAKRGALSTADLAYLFEIPYQTLRTYRRGVQPYETRRAQLEARLEAIEQGLRTNARKFPIPLRVKAADRKTYLTSVLGLPRVESSRR